jgi:hypothetical protein
MTKKTDNTEPLIFEVRESGQLLIADYQAPETRMDAYQLSPNAVQNKEYLLEEASCIQAMRAQIYDISHGYFTDHAMEDWLESDVEAFLEKLNAEQFKKLGNYLLEWLNEDFYETGDDETMPYNRDIRTPLSGSSAAYRLFNGDDYCDEFEPDEVIELLGIEIVEGEHPGSSYYAAELSMPIETANKIAEQKKVAIRFVPAKD